MFICTYVCLLTSICRTGHEYWGRCTRTGRSPQKYLFMSSLISWSAVQHHQYNDFSNGLLAGTATHFGPRNGSQGCGVMETASSWPSAIEELFLVLHTDLLLVVTTCRYSSIKMMAINGTINDGEWCVTLEVRGLLRVQGALVLCPEAHGWSEMEFSPTNVGSPAE